VCSASALAGAAGAQVLREGGNAFDAAIATAAAEAVVLPSKCGIGGEVFALFYEASTGKVSGLRGSGRAPMTATPDYFISRGHTAIPVTGPLAVSVPGEVHAWGAILKRFGSQKWDRLLAPAIELAAEGFPLARHIGSLFSNSRGNEQVLREYPGSAKNFVKPDGTRYAEGDLLVQSDLAKSLQRVARNGAKEFYTGALAKEIATGFAADGGLISEKDLAAHETLIYDNPPSIDYHGHEIVATALPSHGVLTLEVLSLMAGFDIGSMGHNTSESVHTMVEAKRLAFADRLAYQGDPEVVPDRTLDLLSEAYTTARRKQIDPARAAGTERAGELSPAGSASSTSYFCVIDAEGNAVSFIHSLSHYFGSAYVPGNTGILMNNRAGACFFLNESHPNVLAPGKRTVNTIHSYMVKKDGKLELVGGTPGGDGQPQWNAQVISNVLDHGMGPQEAVDAPRWLHAPGTYARTHDQPVALSLEAGFAGSAIAGLRAKGHSAMPLSESVVQGAVQLIAIDPETGVHVGATDRRCDGYPIPE
jgi:gamma-glutamyltranspeptidase/glutathione hydrolase